MDCAYHRGIPATSYCSTCGRPVCATCATNRAGSVVCFQCASAQPLAGAAARTSPMLPIVIAIAFAGVVLIVAALIIGSGGKTQQGSTPAPPQQAKAPPPSPPPMPGVSIPQIDPDLAAAAEKLKAAAQQQWQEQQANRSLPHPGEDAARAVALSEHSSWVAKVVNHSDDWQRVRVWIGLPQSEYVSEVMLQWNGARNRYEVESVKPIESKPAAPTPQPSREKAIAKAKSGHGDWVTRVVGHDSQWRNATVWIGPPESEYVYERTVRWNGKGYDIVSQKALGGDEEPPPAVD